jgi:hypothetical protein
MVGLGNCGPVGQWAKDGRAVGQLGRTAIGELDN